MESLNLSGNDRRSDGWLKSLLWPTVDNAWDVNYLGQQGFWICLLIAVVTLVWSFLLGSPGAALLGLFSALFYFLGGVGVRQGSWHAALVVSLAYGLNMLTTLAAGSLPGLPTIIFAAILLTNLRAAFLASEWKPAGPDEDTPQRFSETLVDKFVDQLPIRLWPTLQIPFYVLGSLVILLTTLALAAVVAHRFGLLPSPPPAHP